MKKGAAGSVAIYLRLSKEEGEGESESIRNQRLLLRAYAARHFPGRQVEEFSDDGFTGTNMDRPGLGRLLEKAEEGGIGVILVKDFSRFSRDYLALGEHLERVFPSLGIRFISLGDGYDSLDHEGTTPELDAVFRGLLYDLYSKDLSWKVKAALDARKRQGRYSMAKAPYGYRADKESGRLVPREGEDNIVRRIFLLALEGRNSVEIADILNGEGICPPGRGKGWRHGTVCAILKNRVYAGDFVYGKYEKEGPGGRNRKKPEKEWKVISDHHSPIVERALFEAVQRKRGKGRGTPLGE